MTPEQEAEARALLAEIAKTQPWAKDHDCTGIAHSTQYPSSCPHCHGSGVIPLANLKVAFAEAVLWLAHRGCKLEDIGGNHGWNVLKLKDYSYAQIGGFEADPYIAVFKAVLALKEQAYERQP